MVQLSLQCALVGWAGSSLDVDIDDGAKVSKLKEAIAGKLKYTGRANQLRLFLAKTDSGAWLTEADVENGVGTNGLTLLKPAEAPLNLVQLTKESVRVQFTKEIVEANQTPVHVLVVVPPRDVVAPPRISIAVRRGPEVDLESYDSLLSFLESEMSDKHATFSCPHILDPDSLQFRLVGRDEALAMAASCYRRTIAAYTVGASDRHAHQVPVCSGMSGLGNTRMLEEASNLLHEVLKLDPNHTITAVVPYSNEYYPLAVEQLMPIEASFSWRLLFRVFLDNNCQFGFAAWIESRLPWNGGQLTLGHATGVIAHKLREKIQGPEPLYLFLGINDYQNIEKVGALRKESNVSLARELVEAVGESMCSTMPNLVLLPMFAGTDLGVLTHGPIPHSVTDQLPMTILTVDQVFSFVESHSSFAWLLKHEEFRRNLFCLGGIPRWIVEYLLELKKNWQSDTPPAVDIIDKCFVAVRQKYTNFYLNSLGSQKLTRLAAFAVSGQTVDPNDMFDDTFKWFHLRDSSLCLLVRRGPEIRYVQVPYSLIVDIGLHPEAFATNEAERNFARALGDLHNRVDRTLFNVQLWQSWGEFGAYFYAARTNALILLGHSKVTLGELLPGTLMSDTTRSISVNLVPSKVIWCLEKFGATTSRHISLESSPNDKVDWTSCGCIAVNSDGEAGIDIFFALKHATTGQAIVIVDQRKRYYGQFQSCHATDYLNNLSASPDFLVGTDAILVRGVMNCISESNMYDVPDNCFFLSRDKSEQFYRTLVYHPACSPVVSINEASGTTLKTVSQGDEKEIAEVVEEILRKRAGPSGGYISSKELLSIIKGKRLSVDQLAIDRSEKLFLKIT